MPAFRAGDLDLTFALRNADRNTALLAVIKLVRVPLFPALLPLFRQFFDLFNSFQKPQPFIGALQMIPGKGAVQGISQSHQADPVEERFFRDQRNEPQHNKYNVKRIVQLVIAITSLHPVGYFVFDVFP